MVRLNARGEYRKAFICRQIDTVANPAGVGGAFALGVNVGCVSVDGPGEKAKRGGRGLLAGFHGSFPPASEREARMDDPTLRRENDAGNETRLSGLPIPSGGPIFLSCFPPVVFV